MLYGYVLDPVLLMMPRLLFRRNNGAEGHTEFPNTNIKGKDIAYSKCTCTPVLANVVQGNDDSYVCTHALIHPRFLSLSLSRLYTLYCMYNVCNCMYILNSKLLTLIITHSKCTLPLEDTIVRCVYGIQYFSSKNKVSKHSHVHSRYGSYCIH